MSTETLTLGPSSWTHGKASNDDSFRGLTGAYQTIGRTGNRLLFVLAYENLVGARRKTMEAHERQLRNRINRLQINMSTLKWVRTGAGGGTPLLVGGHLAGATALSIDGASNTITNWLTAADYITVGNQLCEVIAPCNTSSGGAATISIWPELHKNFADNTPVDISTPFGIFLQQEPAQYGSKTVYAAGDYLLSSLTFTLEQDVLA